LFGNDRPVEIEVGMGKGLFLLNAASQNPATNYFGVELVRKYQLFAATRFAVRGLANVKTACADARRLLQNYVRPASVAALHVYFPDPWWKTRHHKRRLFTPEFADLAAAVVRPGGRLHLATDVEAYFEVMTGLVRSMPHFAELPPPIDRAPEHDMDYLTNFERKARLKGGRIHRAQFERT
jgi:tRNA (guanine-N7-)-methyltransferase